ncbi:host specificity protein J [Undibacterium sp. MH2W]|uniref:host specificity protein J n=1 Tax=Undibacterium sp. MH2W TaxID=3413044 RepID=UPI003BF1C0D8
MRKIIGYGGKSGSGSGSVESPDSLHSISYAKVMDLVSEGEIQGLANGMQSVFFNDTPLQNPDGSYNFTGATVDFRSGSQSQLPIDGFPDVSNEHGVGVELRSSSPWVQNVTNTQLTSLSIRLGVSALSKADTSSGNIGGYQINYIIELSTDGGAYQTVVNTSFNGKTTSQYQRSHRFVLPAAKNGWTVRVTRTTPNANSSTVSDTTTVLTYTELIDARLNYPMSALIGVQIDASQFQSIPTRSYDLLGRIIQVPSNYDPVARTYSGIWDGTLKPAWTNNPAWIFYDLLTNSRYGLGNLIPSSYVDKWGLYIIGQYCDQMVPNGLGGTEPRFTCNVYLQSAAEAYKVLQDLASVFRGITYWASGSIVVSADMPQDPTYTFTAANVIDGKFHGAGSAKSTRYTTATVTWNDPNNFYKQKVEYVQDDLGVQRYGVKPINVTAFGCTSQGQAQRVGQWMLLTSRLETDMLTFSVGLDALVVTPGQIIRIANPNKAGVRNGGRISSAVGRVVTLDKAPAISAGDLLTVILPSGVSATRVVQSISGNSVTVVGDWPVMPQPQAIWSVDNANLVAPTYKILSITEKDGLTYEISAIQHIAGKFDNIDNGTIIQNKPTALLADLPDLPTNLLFSANTYWNPSNISVTDGNLSWSGTSPKYLVQWQRNNDIVNLDTSLTPSYQINSMLAGTYNFTITAVSAAGKRSQPVPYSVVVSNSTDASVSAATSLTTAANIFEIDVSWAIPPSIINYLVGTEIWSSATPNLSDATKLTTIPAPQNTFALTGLSAGQIVYFWVRLVDKRGNLSDYYPTGTGAKGTTSTDATSILNYLKRQITQSQLSVDLLTPIQAIPDIQSTLQEIPPGAELQQVLVDQQNSISAADAMAASQLISFVSADQALANARTLLQASIAKNTASILQESTARANADGSLATQIEQVAAVAGSTSASVETVSATVADINCKLSATHTIKTQITQDGKTYIAGIGLMVDNGSGTPETEIYLSAQKIAFIDESTGSATVPFVVVNGQTFIADTFINNASITNAKIVDAAISSAKIGNLQITTAHIQDLTVGTNKITGNAVTDIDIFSGIAPGAAVPFVVSDASSVLAIATCNYDQNGYGGVVIKNSSGSIIIAGTGGAVGITTSNVVVSGVLQPGTYYLCSAGSNTASLVSANILKVKK